MWRFLKTYLTPCSVVLSTNACHIPTQNAAYCQFLFSVGIEDFQIAVSDKFKTKIIPPIKEIRHAKNETARQ